MTRPTPTPITQILTALRDTYTRLNTPNPHTTPWWAVDIPLTWRPLMAVPPMDDTQNPKRWTVPDLGFPVAEADLDPEPEGVQGHPPFVFDRRDDGTLPVPAAVWQALGAASVCWDSMAGTGVFHEAQANRIGEALLAVIQDEIHHAVVKAIHDIEDGAMPQRFLVSIQDDVNTTLAHMHTAMGDDKPWTDD